MTGRSIEEYVGKHSSGNTKREGYLNELLPDQLAWLCPNVTQLKLKDDPYSYYTGMQFSAVVNRCDVAQKVDQDYNLPVTYPVAECNADLDSAEAENVIQQLTVEMKAMG